MRALNATVAAPMLAAKHGEDRQRAQCGTTFVPCVNEQR
jgi:hypothetical protein